MRIKDRADVKQYNANSKTEILSRLALLETKCRSTDIVRKLRSMQSSLESQLPSDALEISDIDSRINALLGKAAQHLVKEESMAGELVLTELNKLIGERGSY